MKTHGGSIRVYIKKEKNIKVENNVKNLVKEEKRLGIRNIKINKELEKKVKKLETKEEKIK